MKKYFKYISSIIFLYTYVLSSNTVYAETYINDNHIVKNITFTKTKSPYVIDRYITIDNNAKVTIEKDVVLIFRGGSMFFHNASLVGDGFEIDSQNTTNSESFLISGNNADISISNIYISGNPQSIISAWNNSYVFIKNFETSFSGDSSLVTGIQVFDYSKLEINNSIFSKFKKGLDIFNSSVATITDSVFSQNKKAIYTFDSEVFVHKNDFLTNDIAVEFFLSDGVQGFVHAEDNWWGDTEGPSAYTYTSEILQTSKNYLLGNVFYVLWSMSQHKKSNTNQVSNVLFLPGLMGSRLYQKNTFENQLWEPNRNKDVQKLFLNSSGESVEKDIYTRDVMAKTNLVGGIDSIELAPYKDFFTYMDGLVKKDIIQSWKPAPYDWRYSPDTILENGISVGDTYGHIFTNSLIAEVLLLAKTSKTKKVTLVTHSNGGLVGKQLMIELKKRNIDTLIDKIIFIAMPEYGTPQAITSLMYGHEQSIAGGLILSADTAQKLGINMPTAYTLLPSQKYFTNNKTISFDTNILSDKSSLTININQKINVNNDLLHKADQFHQYVDNWIAPPYIKVFQIVGTGLLTVSGVMETSNKKPLPIYTTTGDGVVQDMYDKSSRDYSRSGTSFTVDLHNTKYKHMNIMNYTGTMNYIDLCLRKISDFDDLYDEKEYPIYDDTYTLISLAPAFSTSSKVSAKKIESITLQGKDLLDYSDTSQFSFSNIKDSLARYDLFNTDLQYISQKPIKYLSIEEKRGDVFNVNIFSKSSTQTTEVVYEDIKVFKDLSVFLNNNSEQVNQDFKSGIGIYLPYVNQKVEIPLIKEVIYNQQNEVISEIYKATTTEDFSEKISRIIGLINDSNITSYIKSRYKSKLISIGKNKDEKGLISLREKFERAVKSIDSYANSPALKGRYSKLRQDYIYLSYILK